MVVLERFILPCCSFSCVAHSPALLACLLACLLAGWLAGWLAGLLACLLAGLLAQLVGCWDYGFVLLD